jgi:hypothetical protein
MKPGNSTVAALLVLSNLLCAIVGGYFILGAFREGDCDGGCNAGTLLLWTVGLFAAMTLLSFVLWFRSRRTWRGLGLQVLALGLASLVPLGALHARRHQQDTAYRAHAVRPSMDYSHVLIARADLPPLGVSAGQRCVFSAIDCERQPAQIEALCPPGPSRRDSGALMAELRPAARGGLSRTA